MVGIVVFSFPTTGDLLGCLPVGIEDPFRVTATLSHQISDICIYLD